MTKPVTSIGIIMDGNRRWAKERGLSGVEGHREGAEVIKRLAKETVRLEKEYGLRYVTFYTFSTENWKRTPEEVKYLLDLIRTEFPNITDELDSYNVRVRIIGNKVAFPEDIQTIFNDIEEKTANNTGVTVGFALSYGGRTEILDAVNRVVQAGDEVTEEAFSNLLYTSGMTDPDLIIRTSGEKRLSGFLPWQSVYSELFFIDDAWPDFTVEKLEAIFKAYQERDRRHGK